MTGFLAVGTSSSESLLLLDEAAFLATGVDLTGTTDAFLFVSSSDESESDDESFFLLLERFFCGVDGACFFGGG